MTRCQTAENLQALLEEVRKHRGVQTIRVRFKVDIAPAGLNGVSDFEVSDPNPPRDPALLRDNGVPRRRGRAEILCQMRNAKCACLCRHGRQGMRNEGTEGRSPVAGLPSPVARPHFDPRTPTDERTGARVVGELIATKPAWKRRRASENDEELLQMLAEGMGNWIAQHQAHGS